MGKPHVMLDDAMSAKEISDALRRMVFTSARNWERSVRMTRGARDMIVTALQGELESRKMSEGFSAEDIAEIKRAAASTSRNQ